MSTCTKWVTNAVITCKNWSSQVDYECTTWADEGSNQCSSWADEGSNECSQWADEGSNQCTSWDECHWYTPWNCIAGFFCRAWYWVANWVCQAWYWVANWVCQAWYWLAKWVCKAFAWLVRTICVVWGWIFTLICVAWDTIRCALRNVLNWFGSLFGGRQLPSGTRIEHVFVLMLENRSFDHMFGFSGLTGVDRDGSPTPVIGVDPNVNKNVDSNTHLPVPVTITPHADFALKGIDEDPGHEFEDTLMALCAQFDPQGNLVLPRPSYQPVPGGYRTITNGGFVENYTHPSNPDGKPSATPDRIMRCFDTPNDLPVMFQLAQEFAICDQWFSSIPGPTWPNRFFLLAASSGGLDHSPSGLEVVTATTVEGYRFQNGNIFDLLDENCVEWKIFEGDEFPVSFALSGMNLNALQGRFKDFEDFESELAKSSFEPKFVFIEPKYGAHGFDVTGPGDFTCGNSMHPLDDVTRGEKLVKTVYEAIRNSPHWERSLLLIVFDEHGGFYDHVTPPTAVPPGDTMTQSYIQNHFQYDQLGVRVPALVISPLIPRSVIDHTIYDHTSMLATIERLFGMRPLTKRDAAANDFLHLLSLTSPRTDTPTTLNNPATNPQPLSCEEDDEDTEDKLMIRRSELRMAQRSGLYQDRPIEEFRPTTSQIGFAQVALLKVLQTAEYPERNEWIAQYKAIKTGVDAGLFMTEAKLKILHGIDLKRFNRSDNPDKRLRTRSTSR
jgi:phospholipase C